MPQKEDAGAMAFAEQMTVPIRAIIALTHCVAWQLDAQQLATDLRLSQERAAMSNLPKTLVDLLGSMADAAAQAQKK